MGTRYVHRVRIKKQDTTTDPPTPDDTTYVDVEITDKIAFRGPKGQRMIIKFGPVERVRVIDDVGADCGRDDGNVQRVSHMEKITNPDDDSQSLFIEVLDKAAYRSPNGRRGILYMPQIHKGTLVRDDANLGVSSSGYTRKGHTIKVTAKDNEDPGSEDTDFIGVLTFDTVSLRSENGQLNFLDVSAYDVVDTTQYQADDNGDMTVPPDNTDPNPYVKFPPDADGPWVHIGENQTGVEQGLLWRIVNADANPGPWWAYIPKHMPFEWSSINYDGCVCGDHWDVRCFPYCDAGCGCEPVWTDYCPHEGCNTEWARWSCVGHSISVRCGGSNPGPTALAKEAGYATANEAAKAIVDDPECGSITKLDFKQEPQDRYENPGGLGGGWRPNIWQIVGKEDKQPFHTDPNTGDVIWDQPTSKLARETAKLLEKQWNLTSDAYNAGELAMVGCAPDTPCQYRIEGRPFQVSRNASYPSEVADWKFGCAIVDGPTTDKHTIGNPFYPTNMMDFCGGLPPGGWWGGHSIDFCGDHGYTLWAFHPAFATNIVIEQLDPKVWDTSGDKPKLKKRPDGLPSDAPWPPA